MNKTNKAYKAFNPDWKCRDLQFELGQNYHLDGNIIPCKHGFHSCDNPLDILDYYNIINENGELNKFAEVEISGNIVKEDNKKASSDIFIKKKNMFHERHNMVKFYRSGFR